LSDEVLTAKADRKRLVLCTETRKWREHGTETGQGWEQAGEAGHGRSGR
jgi:hypothetical protein